jgi:2-C-methyl-D-erythritol 4-phosphate cytidylyltransferase
MSNKTDPIWAIVPASGIGARMQGQVPKQYLQLCGKSILEHTLDRLLSFKQIDGVILVLREDDQIWQTLNYQSRKPLITATGGDERQNSVFSGLLKLLKLESADPLVMVHDAVRPLVSHQDLQQLIKSAKQNPAGAILGVPVSDTLKRQDDHSNVAETVERSGLWRAFTPQLFRAKLLLKAFEYVSKYNLPITDDAAAIEALGMRPALVECSAQNIKITHPQDLELATQIMLQQQVEDDLSI